MKPSRVIYYCTFLILTMFVLYLTLLSKISHNAKILVSILYAFCIVQFLRDLHIDQTSTDTVATILYCLVLMWYG